MLGADIIGFHTQSHCNNFMETVDRVVEATTNWDPFNISRKGHVALIMPYPIIVAWDQHEIDDTAYLENEHGAVDRKAIAEEGPHTSSNYEDGLEHTHTDVHRELGIEGKRMLFGVDRLDYTKGIVERLVAIEHLFEEHPWYLEKIVIVQIAAPSRTRIPSYAQLRIQVEETVERINRRFETPSWKPVILIVRQCSHELIRSYYRAADICLVTSLHDGMNMVAKEYIAARDDADGVLVLSRFAGAAQELRDALLVNPYDVQQVTEAIRIGLEMSRGERRLRMERMRQQVKEHNVYRWAANVLTDLCAIRIEDQVLERASHRDIQRTA
jgi:trehalose-6-phosphate synthase